VLVRASFPFPFLPRSSSSSVLRTPPQDVFATPAHSTYIRPSTAHTTHTKQQSSVRSDDWFHFTSLRATSSSLSKAISLHKKSQNNGESPGQISLLLKKLLSFEMDPPHVADDVNKPTRDVTPEFPVMR
jgi:hypothetical protein